MHFKKDIYVHLATDSQHMTIVNFLLANLSITWHTTSKVLTRRNCNEKCTLETKQIENIQSMEKTIQDTQYLIPPLLSLYTHVLQLHGKNPVLYV